MLIQINNEYISKKANYTKTKFLVKYDEKQRYFRYEIIGDIQFIEEDFTYISGLTGESVESVFNYAGKDTDFPTLSGKLDIGSPVFDPFNQMVSLKFVTNDAYSIIDLVKDVEINLIDVYELEFFKIENFFGDSVDYLFPCQNTAFLLNSFLQSITGKTVETVNINFGDYGWLLITAMTNMILNDDKTQKEIFGTTLNITWDKLTQYLKDRFDIVWNTTYNESEDKIYLTAIQRKWVIENDMVFTTQNKFVPQKYQSDNSKLKSVIKRIQSDKGNERDYVGYDITIPNVITPNVDELETSNFYSNIEDILNNPGDYPDSISDYLIMSLNSQTSAVNDLAVNNFDSGWLDVDGNEISAPSSLSLSRTGFSFQAAESSKYALGEIRSDLITPSAENSYSIIFKYLQGFSFGYDLPPGTTFVEYNVLPTVYYYIYNSSNAPLADMDLFSTSGFEEVIAKNTYKAKESISELFDASIYIRTDQPFKLGFRVYGGQIKWQTLLGGVGFVNGYFYGLANTQNVSINQNAFYNVNPLENSVTGNSILNLKNSLTYVDEINKNYSLYPLSTAVINKVSESGLNVEKRKGVEFDIDEFDLNEVENYQTIPTKEGVIEVDEIIQDIPAFGRKAKIKGRY